MDVVFKTTIFVVLSNICHCPVVGTLLSTLLSMFTLAPYPIAAQFIQMQMLLMNMTSAAASLIIFMLFTEDEVVGVPFSSLTLRERADLGKGTVREKAQEKGSDHNRPSRSTLLVDDSMQKLSLCHFVPQPRTKNLIYTRL